MNYKHICISILILSGTVAYAQDTITFASVSGRVTDPSGSVVAGAHVSARRTETNRTAATLTDREGRFRLPYLKVGAYEVIVSHPGFAQAMRPVTLTVGSAFELAIELTVAGEQNTVTVGAQAAVVETARTQIAGTVSQAEVQNLPLNGRNFLDLALVVPGVSPTNTASNQLFAETSAVPGQGISVGSQRNFSNNFIVDGLSANDDAAGLSGIFYGLDVVQEFQVVTSGGQAELGRALGGYINVITKSGTNAVHADLYGYFRNQRFNAANPLSNTKLPSTQAQYGASLGGPVKQDRTFYFANFEERALNQSGLITIAPASVAAINTRLSAVGYQGAQIATGLFSNPVHNTNFLGKMDHQIGKKDQFTVRYSLYDVHSNNSRGAGALNAATASAGLDNTDQTVAVSNVATLSAHTVNETRGQFTYSTLSALPTDPVGPAVIDFRRGHFRYAFRVAYGRVRTNSMRWPTTCPTSRGRTLYARGSTSCTTIAPSRIPGRFAAPTLFPRWRTSLRGHTTTRASHRPLAIPWSRRPIRMPVFTHRTSGKSAGGSR